MISNVLQYKIAKIQVQVNLLIQKQRHRDNVKLKNNLNRKLSILYRWIKILVESSIHELKQNMKQLNEKIMQKYVLLLSMLINQVINEDNIHEYMLFYFLLKKLVNDYGQYFKFQDLQRLNKQLFRYTKYLEHSLQNQIIKTENIYSIDTIYSLQLSSCIGCRTFFHQNQIYHNKNANIQTIIAIQNFDSLNYKELSKIVSSVINKQNGVIIQGATNSTAQIIEIKGNIYLSLQQMHKKQQQIKKLVKFVKPQCNIEIQPVPVIQNNFSNSLTNQISKHHVICFRVKVRAVFPYMISYIQYKDKYMQKIYEVYRINNERIFQQVKFDADTGQSIYSMICKFFHRNKTKVKNFAFHDHIKCIKPKLIQQECMPQIPPQNHKQISYKNSINNSVCQNKNQPKCILTYQSLLVVNGKKDDRHISNFAGELKKLKIVFQLSKPFEQDFKEATRSIWMISHNINFMALKNQLKLSQEKKILKQGQIKLMPIYNILEVNKEKLTQIKQKQLQLRFESRYNKTLSKVQCNQNQKIVYFMFDRLNQSLFVYMVFEQMCMRPYFVKEPVYKKC